LLSELLHLTDGLEGVYASGIKVVIRKRGSDPASWDDQRLGSEGHGRNGSPLYPVAQGSPIEWFEFTHTSDLASAGGEEVGVRLDVEGCGGIFSGLVEPQIKEVSGLVGARDLNW
jgi:hypothetical protein